MSQQHMIAYSLMDKLMTFLSCKPQSFENILSMAHVKFSPESEHLEMFEHLRETSIPLTVIVWSVHKAHCRLTCTGLIVKKQATRVLGWGQDEWQEGVLEHNEKTGTGRRRQKRERREKVNVKKKCKQVFNP